MTISAPKTGYKFGTKNNWRGWLWNRIAERLMVAPKDALVLYLAGLDDLDRTHAMRRGFRSQNLIAVDHASTIIHAHRERGNIGIQDDLMLVMKSWPLMGRHVHVVIGDFCCGLERSLRFELGKMWLMPAFHNCVFLLNVMRGRDSSHNEMRIAIVESDIYTPAYQLMFKDIDPKHRGAHFAWAQLCSHVVGNDQLCDPQSGIVSSFGFRHMLHLSGQFRYAMNSYKSTSGQVFDSLVWCTPQVMREAWSQDKKLRSATGFAAPKIVRATGYRNQTRRKIAAALAVNTRRSRA